MRKWMQDYLWHKRKQNESDQNDDNRELFYVRYNMYYSGVDRINPTPDRAWDAVWTVIKLIMGVLGILYAIHAICHWSN